MKNPKIVEFEPTMTKSLLALAIFSVLNVFSTGPTAAGQFTPESDLAGLTLMMNKTQVKEIIAKRYPAAPLQMLPLTLVMPGYLKNIVGGLVFEAHAGPSNNPRNGADRTKVLFDPNEGSDDVFAIYRYVNFDTNTNMTMASLHDSLVEKYGEPSLAITSFNKDYWTYIWAAKGSGYDPKRCNLDKFGHDAYFYERVEYSGPLLNVVDETERRFVSVINYKGPGYPTNCGTILFVFIQTRLGTNNQYAYEMKETLIDLTRGVSELAKLRSEVFAAIDQIATKKLQKDKENKPEL
jgi:hypothetical protein